MRSASATTSGGKPVQCFIGLTLALLIAIALGSVLQQSTLPDDKFSAEETRKRIADCDAGWVDHFNLGTYLARSSQEQRERGQNSTIETRLAVEAYRYLYQARRLNPADSAVRENFRRLGNSLVHQVTSPAAQEGGCFFEPLLDIFSPLQISLLRALLLVGSGIVFARYLFVEKRKYIYVSSTLLILSVLVELGIRSSFVTPSGDIACAFPWNQPQYGISNSGTKVVYAAPDKQSQRIATLEDADIFIIVQQQGEWCSVEFADNQFGWLSCEGIYIFR